MPLGGWTDIDIASWNVRISEPISAKQNGGMLPTTTVQSTITQSLPSGPFATTNFNNVIEFDCALDEDQTRGLLLGFQDTRVAIKRRQRRSVRPSMIGYAGGYYRWPSNWKNFRARRVQSFGGVELLNRTLIQPFTQPVLRLDLDRMDDNDNRLFGLMLQIQWIPLPSYQLTFRTPLYLTQN